MKTGNTTTIRCNKDLFNNGKCFTAGKEYTILRVIYNQYELIDSIVKNDLGEPHVIGVWWKEFEIVEL